MCIEPFISLTIETEDKLQCLISKLSTYEESYSDGWEPKILNGISLGTKRYDKVLKLRHNAVKKNFDCIMP